MTLCEQLKNIIACYLTDNPNTSVNSLSHKSKVGASTIRRILNCSVKGNPSPHTILNIVSAISNEKKLTKLVKMFDGELGKSLLDSFGAFVELESDHSCDVDINEALEDRVSYIIYKLAANRTGVSKVEVGSLFGHIGMERLKVLLDKKIVKEIEGTIHACEKQFSLDLKVMTKHLPALVRYYDPEQVEMGLNIIYNLSESINEDGIKKIKKITREAAKSIYQVMNSPYYEGDIPFFSVLLGDTLNLQTEYRSLQ